MPRFLAPTRREVLAVAAAAVAPSLLPSRATAGEMPSARVPTGPGSVPGAPHLPVGFANTFASRYVDANGLRFHAVIRGKGRPLLLVHGWPQTWYQWRLVMRRWRATVRSSRSTHFIPGAVPGRRGALSCSMQSVKLSWARWRASSSRVKRR